MVQVYLVAALLSETKTQTAYSVFCTINKAERGVVIKVEWAFDAVPWYALLKNRMTPE